MFDDVRHITDLYSIRDFISGNLMLDSMRLPFDHPLKIRKGEELVIDKYVDELITTELYIRKSNEEITSQEMLVIPEKKKLIDYFKPSFIWFTLKNMFK